MRIMRRRVAAAAKEDSWKQFAILFVHICVVTSRPNAILSLLLFYISD